MLGSSDNDFKAVTKNASVKNYEHAWNKRKMENLGKEIEDINKNQMEISELEIQ